MKKKKVNEVLIFLGYIFFLLFCRGVYLYIGQRKTLQQSMAQLGIELGNFAIIVVFGFLIAVIFLYAKEKYRGKTKLDDSSSKKRNS